MACYERKVDASIRPSNLDPPTAPVQESVLSLSWHARSFDAVDLGIVLPSCGGGRPQAACMK